MRLLALALLFFGASQLLFLINVIWTIKKGKPVSRNKVWEGAHGLEWQLPSPAPYHSWVTPPQVIEERQLDVHHQPHHH